jgi:hypothetical protein
MPCNCHSETECTIPFSTLGLFNKASLHDSEYYTVKYSSGLFYSITLTFASRDWLMKTMKKPSEYLVSGTRFEQGTSCVWVHSCNLSKNKFVRKTVNLLTCRATISFGKGTLLYAVSYLNRKLSKPAISKQLIFLKVGTSHVGWWRREGTQ